MGDSRELKQAVSGPKEAIVETLWDRQGATPYQTRVKCPSGFRIHIFWRGDRDPDMHDHPADFWTFPLVSYVERFWDDDARTYARRVVKAFWPHHRRAEFAHLVLGAWAGTYSVHDCGFMPDTDARPIVTLGWWGKKRREWGFHTPSGWVPWQQYVSQPGWSVVAENDAGTGEET